MAPGGPSNSHGVVILAFTMSTRTTTIKTRHSSRMSSVAQESAPTADEKEHMKMNGSQSKARVTRKSTKTYCLCKKPDDGSPMIHCSACKEWCVVVTLPSTLLVYSSFFARYHFRCVELSERDAEEIRESSAVHLFGPYRLTPLPRQVATYALHASRRLVRERSVSV